MAEITTILFDFDGTVADTNQLILESWQAVYRERTGKDGDEEYIFSTFGEPLYLSMEKAFPDFDVEETVQIYREFQKDIFDSAIKAFPGIVDLISGLHDKGYKIGIVTSRLKPSTIRGSEIIGVKDYIDAFVTVEDTDKSKPDPEPALLCLEKLRSKAEESIMVGDSAFDMGCGKNAGMTTVMVGWSEAAKSEGSVAKESAGDDERDIFTPDHIIKNPEDLWGILC